MEAARSGGGTGRLRSTVVVLEFALALMLATGAGILVKSFVRLMQVDPGLRAGGVVTLRLAIPPARDPAALWHRIDERLRALAGVEAVASTNTLPLIASRAPATRFYVPGAPGMNPDALPVAQLRLASPEFFRVMGIPLRATVRHLKGLTIENTYLLTRLTDQQSGLNIFNNHIIRSKWNYQFTKEFSLRLIGQYVTTISNPALTTLQNTKQFNGDVLFTYLLHPGTAIYVGYNGDLQNIDRSLASTPDGLLRTRNSFINDGRQVFIKLSYLFRY